MDYSKIINSFLDNCKEKGLKYSNIPYIRVVLHNFYEFIQENIKESHKCLFDINSLYPLNITSLQDIEKELYIESWNLFGKEIQLVIVMEELSELITEISHLIRHRIEPKDKALIIELTDSIIMIESVIANFNLEKLVKGYKQQKIKELKKRIERYKNE